MTKRKPPEEHKKRGAPSIYTDELAVTICERLALGESLREICRDEGMPSTATIMRWVFTNPSFREQYDYARKVQAEMVVDDILDIADNSHNDWMERRSDEGEFLGWRENGDSIRRSALRIDARKWLAAKMLPKKYGEMAKHEVSAIVANEPVTIDPRMLTPEAREALTIALTMALKHEAKDASFTEEDASGEDKA